MKLIRDDRKRTGWITAIISDRWVQAKVYDVGSEYGINSGRVSKLVVGKTTKVDRNKNFFNQMDYNYDRGLDFNNLPAGVLEPILDELEALDKVFGALH